VKIPHLRNLYQKIGMFGVPDVPFADPLNEPFQGDQIRGFGFLHDGSVDTLFHFLHGRVFADDTVGGPAVGFQNDTQRRDVEQFLLAFDSNLAPIVGQQITLDATNGGVVGPRIDLLVARAAAGECDLVVKGTVAGEARGWYRLATGAFQSDRATEAAVADAALRAAAATAGQELTYTCVPPGSGERAGVDRDEDGFFDRDERDAGTDPADPESYPGSSPTLIGTQSLIMTDDVTPPIKPSQRTLVFHAATRTSAPDQRVVVPAGGGIGDPTIGGAMLTVYNSAGLTGDAVAVDLPAAQWRAVGPASRPRGYRFQGTGAVAMVLVMADTLQIRAGGADWAYTLDEAAQGRVAVRLRLGFDEGWCAEAPAMSNGSHPSTAHFDMPGRFVGQPKSPPPPAARRCRRWAPPARPSSIPCAERDRPACRVTPEGREGDVVTSLTSWAAT
jgi:hypothetical protein